MSYGEVRAIVKGGHKKAKLVERVPQKKSIKSTSKKATGKGVKYAG